MHLGPRHSWRPASAWNAYKLAQRATSTRSCCRPPRPIASNRRRRPECRNCWSEAGIAFDVNSVCSGAVVCAALGRRARPVRRMPTRAGGRQRAVLRNYINPRDFSTCAVLVTARPRRSSAEASRRAGSSARSCTPTDPAAILDRGARRWHDHALPPARAAAGRVLHHARPGDSAVRAASRRGGRQ